MLWLEEQPRREQPVCGIHDGRDYRPGLRVLLCNTAHFYGGQVTEIMVSSVGADEQAVKKASVVYPSGFAKAPMNETTAESQEWD